MRQLSRQARRTGFARGRDSPRQTSLRRMPRNGVAPACIVLSYTFRGLPLTFTKVNGYYGEQNLVTNTKKCKDGCPHRGRSEGKTKNTKNQAKHRDGTDSAPLRRQR